MDGNDDRAPTMHQLLENSNSEWLIYGEQVSVLFYSVQRLRQRHGLTDDCFIADVVYQN